MLRLVSLFVLWLVAVSISGSDTRLRNVSVFDHWCDIVNSAEPGTEIVFAPGRYSTACVITARGTAEQPIVLRSSGSDLDKRASFVYPDDHGPVFLLENAEYIVVRWLAFADTQRDIDAIRIRGGRNITVEENLFERLGGSSVVSNQRDAESITVRDNIIRDVRYTAMYFGCHDGLFCHIKGLIIERNLINGVSSSQVGYGLEIKLNSYGIVRDNTFYYTKGPAIAVYGSNEGGGPTVVEGNYIEGAQTDAGILVAGGPAIVRNNIVIRSRDGIYAQDYKGRNLQHGVWIIHNTLVDNTETGITLQGWRSGRGNVLAFNAIFQPMWNTALQPQVPPGIIMNNVSCRSAAACFVQPLASPYDFRPKSKGPLVGAAPSGDSDWRPIDDFAGTMRPKFPDVGAIQRNSSGEIVIVGGGAARPKRTRSFGAQ